MPGGWSQTARGQEAPLEEAKLAYHTVRLGKVKRGLVRMQHALKSTWRVMSRASIACCLHLAHLT